MQIATRRIRFVLDSIRFGFGLCCLGFEFGTDLVFPGVRFGFGLDSVRIRFGFGFFGVAWPPQLQLQTTTSKLHF